MNFLGEAKKEGNFRECGLILLKQGSYKGFELC